MAWWNRRPPSVASPSDPTLPLIRLAGIHRTFPGDADEVSVALADVSVDIDRGEFASISGPSGCGKSTLLSILGMLDTPTSGRYWFGGRAVEGLSPAERARVRNVEIGLVFQSFNLIGDMTVYENVEYPLTISGTDATERRDRVMAALERVGIANRATQRPGQLSGGHQQLVSIARALAGRPHLVLADEPTGNLDSKSGDLVMAMLVALHEGGTTVCLATHDPRYIALARRHIYMFDGRIVDRPDLPA
jgi:putative ABC transport system ATP-binding protein